ncbi:MAG: DUF1499 domain-containing protein [Promethearchaeota archaeon]|nr:MAG: DUF1499 domain-containing protein [Candidatus Lokiarchaeota archaeon]
MPKKDLEIGLKDGKFHPCPEYPNCVSSQSTDEMHQIDPIKYTTSKEEAMDKITNIIKNSKRTKIVTQEDDYIHAVFRTALLRFVDDVEFYFDDNEKTIHFKSASRVGRNDWGVNRKRMEKIREQFLNA